MEHSTCSFPLQLFVLFSVFFAVSHSLPRTQPDQMMQPSFDEPSIPHDYLRFPDVKKECSSFLSSAIDLHFDPNRIKGYKPQLSFTKGDWSQDSGRAPLMPLDSTDARPYSGLPDPIPLASFALTHIDLTDHSRNLLKVSGALGIGISRNGTSPEMGRYPSPVFKMWPGSSDLTILFEGVYTESETDIVLCLLGSAMLPSRDSDSSDPWKWMNDLRRKNNINAQPPMLQDDRILLTLRYPKSFTLTSRAVYGEMKSLNPKSNSRYFDDVKLSSQLGPYSNYQFGSEELVSTACKPYPYQDQVIKERREVYRGTSICGFLDRFVSDEVLRIVPNWNCNPSDEKCKKVGPFAVESTNGGFSGVGILVQDVRCEPKSGGDIYSSARVSAVLRVVLPSENRYTAARRTGLGGTTLSAEGVWNSKSGQLCMVGCLGSDDQDCRSRICLYVPTSFSISQRSIVIGQITSIGDKTGDVKYFPLTFERTAHPFELWNRFSASPLTSYKYSKIETAGAFLERSEPFDFGDVIAKSLLSYPTKKETAGGDADVAAFSDLADDLALHVHAIPDPLPAKRTKRPFVQLEIISLGSLLGRYWATQKGSSLPVNTGSTKGSNTQQQLLLNVSAELTITGGELYRNVSVLYVEGLYNPLQGKMYLIGCRDARASLQVLFDSADLEEGMDCQIEVKVEYPPTSARWLVNPTAKISISSRRNLDDPLHFNSTNLVTLPILYREQRDDILSRRSVEGLLRILTLSLAIGCIGSQLFYIRGNAGAIPYTSLVMLGVQALGYSIPLITGAEEFFTKITSDRENQPPSYEIQKNQWYWAMDYLVKVLVLGAFLLTLRLAQKVWKSRIRMLTRSPLESWRVPNDKKIFLISFCVHLIGLLLVLVIHLINVSTRPGHRESYLDSHGKRHKLHDLGIQLEEYIGLVQDFFLLPQIVANYLWKIQCKPLRKAYYMGVTMVRLLPHLYDCVRAPVINPYFGEEYEFVNTSSDFFSKFGDVAIPLVAVLLMVVVYVQQRWNYEKISSTVKSGQKKLVSMGSRVYERLPSMSSFEAELVVSAVKEAEMHGDLRRDASLDKNDV